MNIWEKIILAYIFGQAIGMAYALVKSYFED